MKVLITGGTGLVGAELVCRLSGAGVGGMILTRQNPPPALAGGFSYIGGDITDTAWTQHLRGHDAVVHLAGFPIFEKRWSTQVKNNIRRSRVQGTRVLTGAIKALPPQDRPARVICASAVGYYGTSSDRTFYESDPCGDDLLSQIAHDWEAEMHPLKEEVAQLTILRLGIVLSLGGGMLGRVLPIFKAGLGGKIASGDQWVSWVHEDDVQKVLLSALLGGSASVDTAAPNSPASTSANHMLADDHSWGGVFNVCAPNPVTNKELTAELAGLLRRPKFFKVPKVFLQTLLGEGSNYLVSGQKVHPQRLLDRGFEFSYHHLVDALCDLLS